MFELVQARVGLTVSTILCSIMSFAICVERFCTSRTSRVVPRILLSQLWNAIRNGVIVTSAHESFQRSAYEFVVTTEKEAVKLVEVLNSQRGVSQSQLKEILFGQSQ